MTGETDRAESEIKAFVMDLRFAGEFCISIVEFALGKVNIDLPFQERHSEPRLTFQFR